MPSWLESGGSVRLLVVTSRNVSRMRRGTISLTVGDADIEDVVRPMGLGREGGGWRRLCGQMCVLHLPRALRNSLRLKFSRRLSPKVTYYILASKTEGESVKFSNPTLAEIELVLPVKCGKPFTRTPAHKALSPRELVRDPSSLRCLYL